MDKSWIEERDRFSTKYILGVESFIDFSMQNVVESDTRILCPCNTCRNTKKKSGTEVKRDLVLKGFYVYYREWIHHGESKDSQTFSFDQNTSNNVHIEDDELDLMDEEDDDISIINELPEMIGEVRDAEFHESSSESNIDNFERLLSDVTRDLYPNCKNHSLLEFIVKLLNIKVMNKITNKAITSILLLFKEVLPKGNVVPNSFNRAKRLLSGIGLGYKKIEACKFDCALFWKENKNENSCPVCKEPRWKDNGGKGEKIPQKVLWYFPLKSRLQRLFASSETASDMRWHAEKLIHVEGTMSHPSHSPAWKDFDLQYPDFTSDSRNMRLGLATDGFNPFGNMSVSYSMWPVILIPYNMPLYKCMKDDFFMMSLLIPGPRAPGKDIDVYLRPLVDELKELWYGVQVYDSCSKQVFQLCASLIWTINDFPALSNLFGWSTKGYLACPCCVYETNLEGIRSKICYMGNRCYLDSDHPFRRSKLFDGKSETRSKPREWSGEEILLNMNNLEHKFDPLGKHPDKRKRKRSAEEGNWVKKCIFFELPYWHNLDVMHVEKNICDNVLGTLLSIDGKTKDTIKAHEDLRDLNIRKELHLQTRGHTVVKPKTCYNLSTTEKKGFCEFLKSVKFPDGYAANISRCVKDGNISGLKTHDCHVLLQRLIPAGVRGYLDKNVTEALFELGEFFDILCSKTLKMEDIGKMERNIPLILCKLEKIFPPALFDVMVHLAVHLPQQAKMAGPVRPRWMYPIERYLKSLKDCVRNKARPEGSIAEGYVVKECLTFMSMYVDRIETRFNRVARNYDDIQERQECELTIFDLNVRPFGELKRSSPLTQEQINQVQTFMLNNCYEVEIYKSKHVEELKQLNVRDVEKIHLKEFRNWFRYHLVVS